MFGKREKAAQAEETFNVGDAVELRDDPVKLEVILVAEHQLVLKDSKGSLSVRLPAEVRKHPGDNYSRILADVETVLRNGAANNGSHLQRAMHIAWELDAKGYFCPLTPRPKLSVDIGKLTVSDIADFKAGIEAGSLPASKLVPTADEDRNSETLARLMSIATSLAAFNAYTTAPCSACVPNAVIPYSVLQIAAWETDRSPRRQSVWEMAKMITSVARGVPVGNLEKMIREVRDAYPEAFDDGKEM